MTRNLAEDSGTVPAPLGLRERGKLRRRKRIKEAARAVFVEVGYEAATTREIAERAEVSLGTLFAYAPIKSELLLMIVNDDHQELRSGALPPYTDDTPLMDTMMEFGRQELAYWGKYPDLARQARREIAVVLLGRAAGPEAMRFAARKPNLLQEMAAIVHRKQQTGSIRTAAPPELVAELWWAIYNQHLHNWLLDAKPDVRKGMVEMRRLLALSIEGLAANPTELGKAVSFLATPPQPAPVRARTRVVAAR